MSENPPQLARPPLWLLIGISSCGPFALNVFIPSLPRLADAFSASYGTAQLALTLFLVGVAIGQLVYGPLSDRFGRRPVLLYGLTLGVAGSIACLYAPTMWTLLAGRFAQGFGCCAGLVLARAIVRDIHPRDSAASALAYVTMGMSVMPMIAPSVGGLVDETFGWQASFAVILVFVTVIAFAAALRCPETNANMLVGVDTRQLARGWLSLFASPAFVGYTMAMTLNTVSFFCFLAAAPYLMVSVMGRPPSEYGFWFAGCALGYFGGNFITGRYSVRIGLDRMVRIGNLAAFPALFFGLYWAFFAELAVWALFLPIFAIGFFHGFTQPNLIAGAVSVNPRLAGSASGLLGFVQMALGAGGTFAMGVLQDGTMRPLAVAMFACAIGSLLFHRMAVRARPPETVAPDPRGS